MLRKEEEIPRKLFPNQNMNRGYVFNMNADLCNFSHPAPDPPSLSNVIPRSNNNAGEPMGQSFYQIQSLADKIISNYSDPHGRNPNNLPWSTGRDGKSYSYNLKELEYTSKFEVWFNGCLKYGGTDHRSVV